MLFQTAYTKNCDSFNANVKNKNHRVGNHNNGSTFENVTARWTKLLSLPPQPHRPLKTDVTEPRSHWLLAGRRKPLNDEPCTLTAGYTSTRNGPFLFFFIY